jgi:FtsP/CotA-like multicopper oxidase with cupredoxin domain
VTINLCATAGTVTLPGELAPVPIWGFGLAATPGNCTGVTASLPGPVLSVNEGDTVTFNDFNNLPAGHTLRFEIPGVTFAPGSTDAAVGASVSRTFTTLTTPSDTDPTHTRPGTYLYQSGGDAGRQAAMGLYGALIVRSGTAGQAYDTATTAYEVEATLVLSAVDPAFNAAPDTFDLHAYRATSWLINGQPYPNPGITATAGQRVLLRYLNAGFDNTAMALLGTPGC